MSYAGSTDGESEPCVIRARVFDGDERYYYLAPVFGFGIELVASDGDVYGLHVGCALKGCAEADREAIDAVYKEAGEA